MGVSLGRHPFLTKKRGLILLRLRFVVFSPIIEALICRFCSISVLFSRFCRFFLEINLHLLFDHSGKLVGGHRIDAGK